MKKIISIILGMMLLLSLTACGNNTQSTSSNKSSESSKPLTKEEFQQMYSDPDKFKGKAVDFYAKIFTDPEKDDKGTYIQAWLNPKDSSNNVLIRIADSKLDVKRDDIIHVVGTVEKKFEGKNAFGATITAPVITASKIEKTDYTTAFDPALKTVTLDKEINQNGYVIKISKVEFSKEETRVYLSVTNNAKEKFSFYKYEANAVQGSKQLKLKDNYQEKLPDIKTEILPGVKEEGVLSFEPMDINGDNVKIILEGSSQNYEIKIEPYSFDVPLK